MLGNGLVGRNSLSIRKELLLHLHLCALKQLLARYVRITPLEMLEHLLDNCTLGTMDLDQLEAALNDAWENEDHINEFIRKLEDKNSKVQEAGVDVSDVQIMVKLVKQMYHSGQFYEVDMTNWERKATTDKTYANAKTYFQEKYMRKSCTGRPWQETWVMQTVQLASRISMQH